MAFGNSFNITLVDSSLKELIFLNDNDGGLYRLTSTTEQHQMRIRQSTMKNGRRRVNVEIVNSLFASGEDPRLDIKSYLVHEFPENFLGWDTLHALGTVAIADDVVPRLLQGET